MERHPHDDFEWDDDENWPANHWARLLMICFALAIWGGIAWAILEAVK